MKRQKDMHKASTVMILHMRFGNYPIDINRDGEFGWQEEMPNIVTRTHIHYIKQGKQYFKLAFVHRVQNAGTAALTKYLRP